MKNSFISTIITFFVFASNLIHAETLFNFIKKNDFLKLNNVCVLEYEHAEYLVCVGISTLDASAPSNWKEARIKAKLLSQQQLSKFINDINVNASETIEDILVVSKTDNGITTRKADSRYIEDVKETSEGPLTDIITIGDWQDQNNYYYAIGKKLVR